MNRIDHSNYEAWLLDRMEGNLTPEQERMLDAFLLAHPGLAPGDGELPTLGGPAAGLSRAEKDALKRSLPPTGMPRRRRSRLWRSATDEAPIDDFLVARLEGDLTPAQAEALRAHLIDHPEHQRAERLYALAKLVPDATAYTAKRELERQLPPTGLPTRHTLDDFLVARLEGDLTPEQESALTAHLSTDPQARHAWALMQRARIPAEAVAYPAKEYLRKGGRVIPIGAVRAPWVMRLRVAATVAVLLSVGLWLWDRNPGHNGHLVDNTTQREENTGQGRTEDGDANGTPIAGDAPSPTGQSGDATLRTVNDDAGQDQDPDAGTAPATNDHRRRERVRWEDPTLLATRGMLPRTISVPDHALENRPVPEVGISPWDERWEEPLVASVEEGTPLGGLLAGKLRKRLFGHKEEDTRPLDRSDATAAVDKGLRAVGGDNTGLGVEREGNGRMRSFDLRLGRNLSISASR